uniref:Uncharacterized protein n=1 Tax=viral metagenome TaxID=1070528 RepID=A0A6M3KKQ2_9ZZZZ
MPSRVSRLKERFKSAVIMKSDLSVAGSALMGDSTSGTTFSASGRQTMGGAARVQRDLFIPVQQFTVGQGEGEAQGAVLMATCIWLDVTGSILAHGSGSLMTLDALTACSIAASPRYAFATVPMPTDADTSGCIYPYIDYTSHDTFDTAGSSFGFHTAAAYLRRGTYNSTAYAVRTAACVVTAASYGAAASGLFAVASLPALPSFGASDQMLLVGVGFSDSPVNASAAQDAGSAAAILGVRLRYTACALGKAV